jgi:hypothetical protein
VKPGLEISGAGRGCNTLTGMFEVHQTEYSGTGDSIKRFAADFEQHCDGKSAALRGSINLTASPG